MRIVDPDWPRASVWLASESSKPRLQVIGVPNSRSSLTKSHASMAPLEMRNRLDRFSTFHSELGVDFGDLAVLDRGNWPVSEVDPVPLIGDLSRRARAEMDTELTIYVGGDNAITRPLVAARSESLAKVGLITFDAHHDVRTLENGPNNGNPIRGLVEDHGLPGQNIVQIGIHSFANSASYRNYADKAGITTVTADQIEQIGIRSIIDVALSQLAALCDTIYVDVDVDVLDSAIAPGCPGSRPGGLSLRQLSQAVVRCGSHPAVNAMDFVEVDPTLDSSGQTVDVLAHLFLSASAGVATR